MFSRRIGIISLCLIGIAAAGFGFWRAFAQNERGAAAAAAGAQSGVTAYIDEAGNLTEPPEIAVKRAATSARDFSRRAPGR